METYQSHILAHDHLYTDFEQSSFEETNLPLDFAIQGEGFFAIQMEDGVAVIDIRLRVKHGVKIPELSKKLQASVKEAVQNMTGVVVSKVNLQIAGVDFEDAAVNAE